MPRKTRARRAARPTVASLHKRITSIETVVRKRNRLHVDVRRDEHDEVLRLIEQLDRNTKELRTQFARIAQIQAELDSIKAAWAKMSSPPGSISPSSSASSSS